MAEYDPTTFEGVYNNASTGSFKTTGLQAILAATMRQFVTDIKDSFSSNHKQVTVVTTSDLTLDFSNRQKITFVGSASFSAAKTVTLANDSAAQRFYLAVQITGTPTLDFGSGSVFKSNHNDFVASTQIFSFTGGDGFYLFTGTKVGSNWWLTVEGPFA